MNVFLDIFFDGLPFVSRTSAVIYHSLPRENVSQSPLPEIETTARSALLWATGASCTRIKSTGSLFYGGYAFFKTVRACI